MKHATSGNVGLCPSLVGTDGHGTEEMVLHAEHEGDAGEQPTAEAVRLRGKCLPPHPGPALPALPHLGLEWCLALQQEHQQFERGKLEQQIHPALYPLLCRFPRHFQQRKQRVQEYLLAPVFALVFRPVW